MVFSKVTFALVALILAEEHSGNRLVCCNFQLKIAYCNFSLDVLICEWVLTISKPSGYFICFTLQGGIPISRIWLNDWVSFRGHWPCSEGTRKSFAWRFCLAFILLTPTLMSFG